MSLAIALLLTCAACSEDAPAEQVAEAADEIVAPAAKAARLAKGPWAPRDECAGLEGAAAFRERLAAAVEGRDVDALVALAADDIMLDFGGNGGADELRRQLEDPGSMLWEDLEELTALGCAVNEQGGVTIPWIFAQDLGEADPYETVLVTGEQVPVRRTAEPTSEQIGSVSWDIVKRATEAIEADDEFHPVVLPDGRRGYIAGNMLRSVIDYRLIAASGNGGWRITNLVAGD
jgi:hypothetical protein